MSEKYNIKNKYVQSLKRRLNFTDFLDSLTETILGRKASIMETSVPSKVSGSYDLIGQGPGGVVFTSHFLREDPAFVQRAGLFGVASWGVK